MKPMTNDLRMKIRMSIKNKLDISKLIKNINIEGEDFSNAIIKDFNRNKENLSNIKFNNGLLGEEGKLTVCSSNIMKNCEFVDVKFLGRWFFRKNNCRGSNFNGASIPNVEYQHCDFRECTFCESILRIGGHYSYKSKFDKNLFQDLGEMWGLNVTLKEDK